MCLCMIEQAFGNLWLSEYYNNTKVIMSVEIKLIILANTFTAQLSG